MEVGVVDIQRQADVGHQGETLRAFQTVILAGATVAAQEVPPQTTTDLGLERRETEAFTVAVEPQRLRNADREAVEDPDAFAVVLDAKCRLTEDTRLFSIVEGPEGVPRRHTPGSAVVWPLHTK